MAPRKGRNLSDDQRFAGVVDQLSGGYKTVGQMVYAVLKEAILGGTFAPGEWLRQESLADAIGVSRIPVRTALLQLESEGMITFNPHRGARVRTLTAAQVDEIYRLRILLETYALREACKDITPERLESLRELARQLDKQSGGGEFLDLRIRFYRELYDADHNPLLGEMIDDLRGHVGRYFLGIRFESHAHEHDALVKLIERGDVAAAEQWLVSHLEQVRTGIRDLVSADEAAEAADDQDDEPLPRPRKTAAKRGAATSTKSTGKSSAKGSAKGTKSAKGSTQATARSRSGSARPAKKAVRRAG